MPPSAIVSVPVPRVANVHPRTVAPDRARAGHRHRTLRAYAIADVGGDGGSIDDPPTGRDRERAGAKAADIEPAVPGPLFQVEPAPVTVTVPVEPARLSDEAAGTLFTTPPSWMVSVPVPWPPTTTKSDIRPSGARSGHRHRAIRARQDTNDRLRTIGQCPAGLDCKHPCPGLTDDEILGCRARARDHRRIRRHSVNGCGGQYAVGTPATQLPAVNQSEEVAPVQFWSGRVSKP